MNAEEILHKFQEMSKNTLIETLNIEFTAVGEDFLSAREDNSVPSL